MGKRRAVPRPDKTGEAMEGTLLPTRWKLGKKTKRHVEQPGADAHIGGELQAPEENLHVGLAVFAEHGCRLFYGAFHELVLLVCDLIDKVREANPKVARHNVTASGTFQGVTISVILVPVGKYPHHSLHVFANDGKWPVFPVFCRAPPDQLVALPDPKHTL